MSAHLKILYVINGLGTGGAERSLAEMLPELERSGIEPTIVCLYRRQEGVEALVRDGYAVRFIDAARTPARAGAIRKIVNEVRPDIVHTTILEASLAGRLSCIGKRTVVLSSLVNTSYAPIRLQDPRINRRRLGFLRALDGWTSRHLTDHFHAITQTVADHAVEKLRVPRDRITVVPRGRDARRWGDPGAARRRRARRSLGIADDAEVLVNLGRQDYQKGQRYFLEAVAALGARRPSVTAILAGRSGTESADLERMRSGSGLGDRLRLYGNRNDVPELLAAADVFVFPSLFEGLGGSLIEAMALALPVVASDIPAIREVVDEGSNAILVPLGSSLDLASGIEALLDDPQRRSAFARRSREIFEERFTLDRSTAAMIDLYRRLAVGTNSRPVKASDGADAA